MLLLILSMVAALWFEKPLLLLFGVLWYAFDLLEESDKGPESLEESIITNPITKVRKL